MFDTTFQSPGVQWYFCIFTLIIVAKALVRKKNLVFFNLVQLSQNRFVSFYLSEAQIKTSATQKFGIFANETAPEGHF